MMRQRLGQGWAEAYLVAENQPNRSATSRPRPRVLSVGWQLVSDRRSWPF